jgi:hypothetical protein
MPPHARDALALAAVAVAVLSFFLNEGAAARAAPAVAAAVAAAASAWLAQSGRERASPAPADGAAASIAPTVSAAPQPALTEIIAASVAAALSAALQREASRPVVAVRYLERAGECRAPLSDTLALFRAAVARAARVDAATARLYWFPRAPVRLSERRPLDSEAAFAAFCAAPQSPDVWIYEPREGAATPPPTLVVAAPAGLGTAGERGDGARAAAASAPRASDDGSRTSTAQRRFRAAVLRRDGAACVLCNEGERSGGGKSALEAAHVVAVRADERIVASVELLNRFDTMNGVTLCAECHYYFDRHLWRVTPEGAADVADALLARAGCERWHALHGRALRAPATPALREQWPSARLWAVQSALFEAAREERAAAAG